VEPLDVEKLVSELEIAVDRLRSLYEQYFMGIEKLEPTVPRKDVERKIQVLRKEQIRNTAQRFRFQMLLQRYNTYQTHWLRICREIENGTFKRHVLRAKQRFGDAASGRRSSLPPPPPAGRAAASAGRTAADIAAELAELDQEFAPGSRKDGATWLDDFDSDLQRGGPAPPAQPAPPRAPPPMTRSAMSTVPAALGASLPPPAIERPVAPAARTPIATPQGAAPPGSLAPAAPRAPGLVPRPAAPPAPRPAAPAPAPRPAAPPAPLRQAPPAAPAARRDPNDLPEERVREIYARYVEAKRRQNESTAAITFDAVAKSLRDSSAKLREKHGKSVDFEVAVKDGKAILKPILK